jgi:hypothetical protein
LNANSSNPLGWTIDEETHVAIVGHICYDRDDFCTDDDFCADNGKYLDGNDYVEVNLNGNVRAYSGPFDIPKPAPGQPFTLQIRVIDRVDYSDNGGAYTRTLRLGQVSLAQARERSSRVFY